MSDLQNGPLWRQVKGENAPRSRPWVSPRFTTAHQDPCAAFNLVKPKRWVQPGPGPIELDSHTSIMRCNIICGPFLPNYATAHLSELVTRRLGFLLPYWAAMTPGVKGRAARGASIYSVNVSRVTPRFCNPSLYWASMDFLLVLRQPWHDLPSSPAPRNVLESGRRSGRGRG